MFFKYKLHGVRRHSALHVSRNCSGWSISSVYYWVSAMYIYFTYNIVPQFRFNQKSDHFSSKNYHTEVYMDLTHQRKCWDEQLNWDYTVLPTISTLDWTVAFLKVHVFQYSPDLVYLVLFSIPMPDSYPGFRYFNPLKTRRCDPIHKE